MIINHERQAIRLENCEGVRIEKSLDHKIGEFVGGGILLIGIIIVVLSLFDQFDGLNRGMVFIGVGFFSIAFVYIREMIFPTSSLQVLIGGNWVRIANYRLAKCEELYEEIESQIRLKDDTQFKMSE